METLGHENQESVELFINCKNLPKEGFFKKGDAVAFIYRLNKANGWDPVGKTEVVPGDLNPTFRNPVKIDYVFQQKTVCRLLIADDDGMGQYHEVGSIMFDLPKLMATANHMASFNLVDKNGKPAGTATVTGSAMVKDKFSYHIDLKCKDVKDLEWFSKSDPCLRIYRPRPAFAGQRDGSKIPDNEWYRVHETEYKKDNLNPDFDEFTLTANKLNRGDEDMPLKMELWDFSKQGGDAMKKIGGCYWTVNQILKGGVKEFQTLDADKKPSGTIIVQKFEKERTFDMLDYLKGGLNIGQVLAIDYTSSNGNQKDPKSLHFFDKNSANMYEQAIQAAGSVLFQYDKDGQVPVYGFGAKFPSLGVTDSKDFFYIQTLELSCASTVGQACALYNSALEYAELAGPCRLAPSILSTADWVKSIMPNDKLFYGVLLILTAGGVADIEEVKSAIVANAHLPFSIIIVGIGNNAFADLEVLDGDKARIKDKTGKSAVRDIVTFVDYKKVDGVEGLSHALLSELPHQIVQYMHAFKIKPNVA